MRNLSVGWTVVATSVGFALIQLEVTIVNVALPAMGADLGTPISGLQWVVDGYALVFACLLLSAGFLSDRQGARRVYVAGIGLFLLASLACGLAQGGATLIAGRILQGVGAAAMLPSSLALINHACGDDAKLRSWAIGWWLTTSSLAIASGPLLGGLLIGFAGWRSIFFVNVPICLIGGLLALRLAETARAPGRRGFDLPGQILGIIALGGLTGAVIEAGRLGLSDPVVVACGVAAVVAGSLFVWVERRVADPMLPARLFATRVVRISIVYGAVVNFTYYGILFVLSLYLQSALGYSAPRAGLAFIPLTLTFALVNKPGSWMAGRGHARIAMASGMLVDALGFALLLRLDQGSGFLDMLPAFLLMPAGMGFGIPAMMTTVLASVDRDLSGVASAAVNASRQAGGALGVAIFGVLVSRSGSVAAGLHASAILAVVLLLGNAILAWVGVGRTRSAPAAMAVEPGMH